MVHLFKYLTRIGEFYEASHQVYLSSVEPEAISYTYGPHVKHWPMFCRALNQGMKVEFSTESGKDKLLFSFFPRPAKFGAGDNVRLRGRMTQKP